jgi:hypothetical protein
VKERAGSKVFKEGKHLPRGPLFPHSTSYALEQTISNTILPNMNVTAAARRGPKRHVQQPVSRAVYCGTRGIFREWINSSRDSYRWSSVHLWDSLQGCILGVSSLENTSFFTAKTEPHLRSIHERYPGSHSRSDQMRGLGGARDRVPEYPLRGPSLSHAYNEHEVRQELNNLAQMLGITS